MKFKKLKYKEVPQSDSVVVLAAGLSALLDKKIINDYVSEHDSIVISANHDYTFIKKIDYTYFGDPHIFLKNFYLTRGIILLSVKIVDSIGKSFWNCYRKKDSCYEVFTRRKPHGNCMSKWTISEDGTFPSYKYSSTGFAAACISLLFRPKEVLLSGLDGPEFTDNRRKKERLIKKMFNGDTKKYKTFRESQDKRKCLEHKVIPLLKEKDVDIKCVPSSKLYGIDKKKHDITLIGDKNVSF